MSQKRKRHSAEFKAKVALEAVKGLKTSSELAREYQVHPTQISQWKRQLLDTLPEVFRSGKAAQQEAAETLTAALYEEIGRLKMELNWLKKALPGSTEGKRMLIQPDHLKISTARQCELVGLPRSSYYYQPAGETDYNLGLMRLIDEQYLRTPFFGSRQMTDWLRLNGHPVNASGSSD